MVASHEQDQQDRELWQRFRAGAARRAPSTACPDVLQLAAYLDGRGSARAIDTLEHHLTDCARCLAVVGELRGLLQPEPVGCPAAVIQRANDLGGLPVARRAVRVRWQLGLQDWLAAGLRHGLACTASVALVALACTAGLRTGQHAAMNHQQAVSLLRDDFALDVFGRPDGVFLK